MAGFTKLFSEIVTSSIWSEDDKTRLVWITLLALVDNPKGEVPASIPGLANAARVSIKDCEKAVKILESPDEYSRTKEHEGRRIKPIDGGWLIINYEKHRNREDSDPRKVADRERQRRHRAQMSRDSHVTSCDVASASASVSKSSSKEGGVGEDSDCNVSLGVVRSRTANEEYSGFDAFWAAYPRKVAKQKAVAAWYKADIPVTLNELLAILEKHKATEQWTKDGGSFIPHPATWINGRRWEDDVADAQGKDLIY